MINGLLIQTNGQPVKATVDGSLGQYYDLLNCDLIGIIQFQIGGTRYRIVYDDEFLFKDYIFPSVVISITTRGKYLSPIWGPALITGEALEDDGFSVCASLTQAEIDKLFRHIQYGTLALEESMLA